MSQFYQAFFEEAEELLAEAEQLLLSVDIDKPDREHLNAIFRAAHSIKGGAATFGFNDMTEITHELETLLDRIRKGEMTLLQGHIDLFLLSKDVLELQLAGHRNATDIDRHPEEEIKLQLRAISEASVGELFASLDASSKAIDEAILPVDFKQTFLIGLPEISDRDIENLKAELEILGRVALEIMPDKTVVFTLETDEDEMSIVSICAFIVDPDDLKISFLKDSGNQSAGMLPINNSEDDGFGFFGLIELHKDKDELAMKVNSKSTESLKQVFEPKLEDVKIKNGVEKVVANQEATSIRVGVEKVDQLINLVGELVITQAMLEEQVGKLGTVVNESLFDSMEQLTRNTRDLQESVMSIRMMPMDYVFSRFPRMVRDLASRLGKRVDFITDGSTTELDKGLIEKIIDPLTHLVRNSIDHGIEIPIVRKESGKTETGKLALSASNRGGSIVIEVSDDGAGLSRERILNKALENGLAVSESMTDSEVWQLIFAPGFSTADVVTDVSGRGVGMDVVKRNIGAMGGAIDIKSIKGRGTTISISLPLTLAILDGMSVSLGSNIYVVPLNLIVETLQPHAEDIKTVTGQGLMVHVRGKYLPIIALSSLFNQETAIINPTQGVLVIIEAEEKKAALLVDGLMGQQQVVIKSLETNFKRVTCVSGATIMGDGSVALILDVPAIIKSGQYNYSQGVFQ
jgi:two-component system chemotaxis sensor kinase CheA